MLRVTDKGRHWSWEERKFFINTLEGKTTKLTVMMFTMPEKSEM